MAILSGPVCSPFLSDRSQGQYCSVLSYVLSLTICVQTDIISNTRDLTLALHLHCEFNRYLRTR